MALYQQRKGCLMIIALASDFVIGQQLGTDASQRFCPKVPIDVPRYSEYHLYPRLARACRSYLHWYCTFVRATRVIWRYQS